MPPKKTKPKKGAKLAGAKPPKKPSAKAAKKAPAPPLVSTGFWLMKSEPESYSIEDLKRDQKTLWTGVRNYLARNYMMHSMKPGDQVLFYHSSAEPPGVAGLAKITRVNLPDPSALDTSSHHHDPKASTDHPIWFCAEVSYEGHLKNYVPLEAIRAQKSLSQMPLLAKGQRLSIQPVSKNEFATVVKMGDGIK